MVIIIILLWVGSIAAGYLNFYYWLAIPMAFFLIHVMRTQRHAMANLRRNGMTGELYRKQMLMPNVRLILWTAFVHGLLFALGKLLSWFFFDQN